ncbi:hypothetical protein CLF_106638 [Clonorchis sinensis]|uniref:Uncharacterized protein n=1 Tax=Clonorchis sinensis TaxID=79923 RepID=G7YQ40_CLOSI|nr:hypothetical protein CLF_106638 [Clonorchis sinensis]
MHVSRYLEYRSSGNMRRPSAAYSVVWKHHKREIQLGSRLKLKFYRTKESTCTDKLQFIRIRQMTSSKRTHNYVILRKTARPSSTIEISIAARSIVTGYLIDRMVRFCAIVRVFGRRPDFSNSVACRRPKQSKLRIFYEIELVIRKYIGGITLFAFNGPVRVCTTGRETVTGSDGISLAKLLASWLVILIFDGSFSQKNHNVQHSCVNKRSHPMAGKPWRLETSRSFPYVDLRISQDGFKAVYLSKHWISFEVSSLISGAGRNSPERIHIKQNNRVEKVIDVILSHETIHKQCVRNVECDGLRNRVIHIVEPHYTFKRTRVGLIAQQTQPKCPIMIIQYYPSFDSGGEIVLAFEEAKKARMFWDELTKLIASFGMQFAPTKCTVIIADTQSPAIQGGALKVDELFPTVV